MSSEGFCYFLPAYLSIFVLNPNAADVVGDAAVSSLIPTRIDELTFWQRQRFQQFNGEQRDVIVQFLQYVYTYYADDYAHHDMQSALEYWIQ